MAGAPAALTLVRKNPLAERLGHAADARLVIISCDDLGLCHAANVGVYRAIRDGRGDVRFDHDAGAVGSPCRSDVRAR